MQQPLQITIRDIPASAALDAAIREKAAKLDQFYNHIMSCRVVVEAPHGHHHKGKLYHVSVDLTVPGEEIAVNRAPGAHHAHEDVYVALRDAFDAARRKLQEFARKQRGETKRHDTPLHGKISELVPLENYGRIVTSDGRQLYFHRNSLLEGDFDGMKEGAEVRFTEEMGDAGPQASSVHIVGKHHIVE